MGIGKENDGRGERIRTSDPLVPNQVRYQTALRPEQVRLIRNEVELTHLAHPYSAGTWEAYLPGSHRLDFSECSRTS